MQFSRSKMVLLVVAMAVLAASVAVSAEDIVITQLGYVWHGDPWHDYMNARIAEFEKLHPNVKIERIMAGSAATGGSMSDKLLTMIAGGVAPDVAEFSVGSAAPFVAQGLFADLRQYFAKDASTDMEDFVPPAQQAVKWSDGTVWGMPIDVYPVAPYYNKDFFSRTGIPDPNKMGEADWNWDFAMKAMRKMTSDTNGDRKVDQWGLTDAWTLVSSKIPIKQAGGSIYDRNVNPTLASVTNSRVITALDWVAEIYNEGINAKDYSYHFQDGVAGLTFGVGPTWIGTLSKTANFEWDVSAPLMGPDNNGSMVTVDALEMTKYSEHPEIVWEWMKFLAADEENLRDFVIRTTRIPAYGSLLGQYPKLIPNAPAGVGHFGEVVLNPKSFTPAIGAITDQLDTKFFNTFMSEVSTGKAAVRPTMEALNDQLNAMIKEYQAEQK